MQDRHSIHPDTMYIYSRIASQELLVESSCDLGTLCIRDAAGRQVEAPLLSRCTLQDGALRYCLDASRLAVWSPDTPVLYRLCSSTGAEERFGHCELRSHLNQSILLNGSPIYLRGVIRGIIAHDHPNMTAGSLKDAAVKYLRQAKRFGFNLVRFHSTIPWPEFVEAADEEGMLIHAEIGFAYDRDEKGEKTGLAMDQSAWRETLLKYRNHPSMAIFCIGNEMHNSGRNPVVQQLYSEGRRLAASKLIMDNSGWGEYDRTSADVFSQHIAYFFPYGAHARMFHVDDPWRINGSVQDEALDREASLASGGKVAVHRAITPVRPVLAHEAVHYIDVPDYYALREKFDAFCRKVGPGYLEKNGITRPKYLDALPKLIERKGLLPRFPEMVRASRHFKQLCLKRYLEACRLSALCGFEMLQFADCLKYENKNGIVDFFDDDKYIRPEWMRTFNDNMAILADIRRDTFFWKEGTAIDIYASDFLAGPRITGDVIVTALYADGVTEELCRCPRVALAGGLQKLVSLEPAWAGRTKPGRVTIQAVFKADDGSEYRNSWELWGYPQVELPELPADALATTEFDDTVLDQVAGGKTVLWLMTRAPAADQPGYFLPGARERFKPCIWDRGSNLGGVVEARGGLQEALGGGRYFDLNLYPLLEDAYKVNLDTFPVEADQWIWGVDKPVRDRMKGLVWNIKEFIDADTLRKFSHLFAVKVGAGTLVVCTLHTALEAHSDEPAVRNFTAALVNALPDLARTTCTIAPEELRRYLRKVKEAGPSKEDTMNHFWEIDNKLVEDQLFWEEAELDLRKID